jgi:hypothetical protein
MVDRTIYARIAGAALIGIFLLAEAHGAGSVSYGSRAGMEVVIAAHDSRCFNRVSIWPFISRLFREGLSHLEFICRNEYVIGTVPSPSKGFEESTDSTADLERECDMAQIRQRTMAPPAHVVTRTCWRRSQLIACLMLAVSAIVFEMNGHTPGAVNLRGRDLLPAVSLMDGRQFR